MRVTTAERKKIGRYDAHCAPVEVGDCTIALWQVDDLEAHVDRAALLAGDDPAEPPYWAHLWSGARVLAEAVPAAAGRVVEIGCGLGLPGLVAAARGARVVLLDRDAAALAFVGESLRANGLAAAWPVRADFTRPPFGPTFDLVLAAEVVYDRAGFSALAAALAALAGPQGRILLTDGHRIDTRDFYPALERAGLVWRRRAVPVDEEGVRVEIDLVEARCAQASPYLRSLR
ncbi:MAG TPA: methyltransferase [Candidatus Limnocylindria bacterium]|nr:methyltransferase [Candidatus Limnocylindria bacterium]